MIATLALLAAVAVPAAAATNGVVELPPVTVFATRIDATAESVPSCVQVLDAGEIARTGARDLTELLEKRANIPIRTLNANPLQSQIAMRGFGENSFGRVKVLVDGEDVGSVDMDAPNLVRVPIGSVERVEIIRGPSPVLYGDGAVAGVINILTDTRDYAKKTAVAARGGSYGTFGANIRTKGGFEEEGLLYSGAYDYARSDGYRDRSGYDTHAFTAALRKNFANGSTVGFKANYFNALYEMPGALTRDEWRDDPRQARYRNDWCRTWSYGFALDSKLAIAEDQWLFVDGVFAVKHRTSNWGDYGYANDYDLYSFQFAPRYVNEKSVYGLDNRFTLGFDFRYDRYWVEDRSGWNSPKYDFARTRYAGFLQDELWMTEDFSALVGARVEAIDNRWSNYKGVRDPKSLDVMGDAELGLVYRPVKDMKTYLKGTVFHRSPFCDEMTATEEDEMLKPEKGASLDLGLDYAFDEEFSFEFAGYWTVIRDEIFYDPHAKEYAPGSYGGYNCNSPALTSRLGFDTALAWVRDKVAEASIRYSLVEARFMEGDYAGETVPLVPENRVRAEAGVWLFDDLEIKAGFTYVSSQVLAGDFENAHERLPGYPLFDIGAVYEPSWSWAEGWKVTFTMDNLLDRNYCDFAGWSDWSGAYYYPACGRSFLVTVSYSF